MVRAILECYWPATNSFVMPNCELGFSLRDMKEITGLPILGELYEEHVPQDSELAAESEEFWALLFLMTAFFEYTRDGHGKPKYLRWYHGSGANEDHRAECHFFKGDGIYRKVKRDKNLFDVLENFKFYLCHDFLARKEKKFVGITRRFELALFEQVVFIGGGSKEIKATMIHPACRMTFGEMFTLALAIVLYLCSELQVVAFMARFGLWTLTFCALQ